MFSIGAALGGSAIVYLGQKLKASSTRAYSDTKLIADTKDITSLPAKPSYERESDYVTFSGRLNNFDSPLLKSAMMQRMNSDTHDAIRIKTKTYQRTEDSVSRSVAVVSENLVSESETGGIVAVEPFNAGSAKVLLRDSVYIKSLYKGGVEEFKPAVESSISVFGERPASKTIGFRVVERLIPANQVVSGVGLVEAKMVAGAAGAPTLQWVLASPDHAKLHGRPSFLVYGDKDDLVQQRQNEAGSLADIGDVVTAVGVVGIVFGCYNMVRNK
ncbi:unnamed protein product [Aphanomyces euteiches]|uniref:Uncharacterized protein n=1 Tax=Aphanomyces euteiches TaxID=100861 RepID=A0A6G0XTC9_9STRA|nr:hypothetical protein Ae201684_001355 [Aphanomyces euteiches]KAH9075318.1 hypothetical protein Ae201684P_003999 [Aphanomyces euteiches]KAH9141043.1 hypothetical protein AeRB84_014771 [Aphanomyces euteiches]